MTVRLALPHVALLMLSGCSPEAGILAPAGEIAQKQFDHLVSILLWMLPVVIPLFLALPVIAWRHRIGGRGRYTPDWEFSLTLELLIWGLPAVIVAVLGWTLWHETLALDPYDARGEEPLIVEAVAYDWKWLFVYPSLGIATADSLTLPEDRPVTFRLTSATVLQAFAIPRIGGQIYAMPGMATEFNLRTGAAGDFHGLNMQYNGEDFARQGFGVKVVSSGTFDGWAAEVAASAPPLDGTALKALAERGTLEAPMAFGSVPQDPFAQAMHMEMPMPCHGTQCGDGT